MLGVFLLKFGEKDIQGRYIIIVILFDISGTDQIHNHREVLFIRWSLIEEVEDKCLKKHFGCLIPEGFRSMTALRCRVLDDVSGKTLNIIVTLQVHERVVTMASIQVNEIKDPHVITLVYQVLPASSQSSTFWVKHDHRELRVFCGL